MWLSCWLSIHLVTYDSSNPRSIKYLMTPILNILVLFMNRDPFLCIRGVTSPNHLWFNTSVMSIRLSTSTVNNLDNKSYNSEEQSSLSSIINLPWRILVYNAWMLFAWKGTFPKQSRNRRTPRLQISVFSLILPSFNMTSGARYTGVPPVSYIFLVLS